MEEYDYPWRTRRSPRDDSNAPNSTSTTSFSNAMSLVTPPRNNDRYPQQQQQQHSAQSLTSDLRSNLTRRFTTESGNVPTMPFMNLTSPQRGQGLGSTQANRDAQYAAQRQSQMYTNGFPRAQPARIDHDDYDGMSRHGQTSQASQIEQSRAELERIRAHRRKFEQEMEALEQRHQQDLLQMTSRYNVGHQSEPTTPPEHNANSGFPSMWSRPARMSMSNMTSPPGFMNRPGRSGSHLISPPSGMAQARAGWDSALPSRSVPTTRRNSDDEERDENIRQEMANHRGSHAHRYSMPGSRPRNGAQDNAGLDTANITRFLWDDEEGGGNSHYNANEMGFPTLTRTEDQILSASSAALDLALSSSPNPETSSHNWSTSINRHRPQQSLSALNGPSSSALGTLGHRPASLRQSLDLNYIAENSENAPGSTTPTQASHTMAPPRLQSSYSSNDVPTVKSPTGSTSGNANNHAQQHFHNHNASIGRIPTGVLPSSRGHSRQLSQETNTNGNTEQPANTYPSIQSTLHANAPVFGPGSGTSQNMNGQQLPATSQGPMHPGFQPYYPVNPYMPGLNGVNGMPVNYGAAPANGNYNNINMLTAGMQNMGMNSPMNGNMNGMAPMYPGQNFVPPYNPMPYNNGNTNGNANNGGNANMGQQPLQQPRDSQARVMQNRRQADNEAMSRYSGLPLEHFHGQIYELCKDQHGCRYLQKKLEEQNPDAVHMIWLETNQHVIELMTDPFGNYLCQKLLEYCNDEERTILIQNAAQDMVRIALNTHGTRALQKMIEYVQSPQQIQVIIEALRFRVVELIQDLNGNHVIQKCLNKLSSPNSQFIFDAVGGSCVEVGTHRHGCCVLQRCIDHASGEQKLWLIQRITEHARVLVQDPFGNYVVQYIIDLGEPTFTEPIVATFQGCVSQLSRHKFSSNVMEKCLRCALPPSKDMIVEEMISAQEIERLIRDSYANYVVQTALEYATPSQKHRLVEAIRPVLPSIRNTPYGRRIQAKISTYDGRGSVTASGQATPADNTQGQIPLRPAHQARGPAVNGGSGHSSQTGSQVLEQALNAYQNSGAQQSPANGHGNNNNNNQGHMNGNVTQPPSGQQGQQGNGAPWM